MNSETVSRLSENLAFSISSVLIAASLTHTARGDVIYSQLDGALGDGFGVSSQVSQIFPADTTEAADDFVVPSGLQWNIEQLVFDGQSGFSDGSSPAIDAANLRIFEDNSGLPGGLLVELLDQPVVRQGPHDFLMNTTLQISSGTYWLSVQASQPDDSFWVWSRREPASGLNGVWRNPLDGFGSGHTDWTEIPDLNFLSTSPDSSDLVFEIRGTTTAVPEPSSALLVSLAGLVSFGWSRRRSPRVPEHRETL